MIKTPGMSSLDQLRSALQASPDNVPLLMLYGQTCLDEFQFEEALESFQKAVRSAPASIEAALGVARTLYVMGRLSEASVRTEALTRQHPGHGPAWILSSRVALAEQQLSTAREHYARARTCPEFFPDQELEEILGSPAEKKESPGDQDPPRQRIGQTDEGWVPEGGEDRQPEADLFLENPGISFADVGGMDDLKEEIRMKILYPIQNPELFRAYGKKIGGGVLMYGPPGCGKTLISRATAGEIKANFISIGIHQILDLYIGNSEKNLHALFELARANRPSVLFFDEVDALAADRTDLRKSAGRTLINQFLAELDGTLGNNEGLLVLGATNAPWHIDPAFRRPGRFDRILFVPPPDESARCAILERLGKDKPLAKPDFAGLARKTKEFTGADLKAVFDLATEASLAQAMKHGRIIPITGDDLAKAAKQIKPSAKSWFESAKNYALYANQSGFYNDVLQFLGISK